MANGLMFPTGVSAQPIDVSSGARAFARSAVETRLQEIAASTEQISESKKNVLKALSIKALPELARGQRDRYQKEIEDYRAGVIDRFKKSGGKLTLPQQTEIQDGFVDLQQRQLAEVNELKKFESATEALKQPGAWQLFDTDRAEQVAGDAYSRLMKGEGLGNFEAEWAQTFRAPSAGEFISKTYAYDIENRLDLITLGQIKGNIFKKEELRGIDLPEGYEQSIAKAERLRDDILQESFFRSQYTSPDGTIDETRYAEKKQEVEDIINSRRQEVQKGITTRPSTKYGKVVDYTPTPFAYKGKDYKLVRVPSDVSQTERNFFVNNATNLDTGKASKLTQDNAQIVGVDVDNGILLLEGKGGYAQKSGETVYVSEGITPSKSSKGEWRGTIESKFDSQEFLDDTVEGAYEGDKTVKEVKNAKVSKTEDGMIVTGTVVVKKWGRTEEVPVEVKYNNFTDPAAEAVYEAPLLENKEAVANMFPKVSIYRKPLELYFKKSDKKGGKGELD